MAVDPIKYNQIASVGTLEAGDTVLGEKVSGTTGRLTVGQLQPSDGDKGDIVVSGSGLTWTVDNDAITYAKMQNVSATDKLLGRSTSGAGDVEEITCTAAGRNLLDDANAAAQRTTLGLVIGTDVAAALGADDNYVTDAEKVKLSNLSGTNSGDQTSIVGISGTKAEYNTSCSDGDFLFTDGGTGTGTYDFGGATSFEIPNDAAPTVNADGEIAVDTSVTDFSHGILKYYSGEELAVISVPIAQLTSPTNGYAILYNSTADEFQLGAVSSFNPNTTAGTENVVSGATAGDSIASGGNFNTLIGYDAGTAITTGDNHVAVGHSSLKAVTTTSTNAVAIGHSALTALTTGTGMCAVGYQAGASYTTQTDCTIVGNGAATGNTGSSNTAIGAAVMANGTASRASNVIIGAGAGNFGTGSNTVTIGAGVAGRQHAGNCVYVGYDSGRNSTGADNVAIGYSALGDGTGGAAVGNVAIGNGAMISGATGAVTFTTASGNTCIGNRAAVSAADCLNAIAIGRDAVAVKATGATSGDAGPGISIGSAAFPVGFRGDGTIYAAAGASAGYWRVRINGTQYKIELFADA